MSSEQHAIGSVSVGVDLGGTNIRVAVFDADMELLGRAEVLTEAQEGVEHVVQRIAACVREALDHASVSAKDAAGVGVGAAGLTNWETGVVILASNLGWQDVPLKQYLSEALDGMRVEVDKDTNAAALAEGRLGAGKMFHDFLYVTAGTGIGGGLVLGGMLYRGAIGGAGDIGHVAVDPEGPPCGCGDHGHVEVFSSGAGIVDRTKEILASGTEEASSTLVVEGLTTEDIFEAAHEGDAVASRVVERAGTTLGLALANYINTNNPEAIILGGGVTRAGDLYTEPVERELRRRALPALAEVVKIVSPGLGDDAGVMGAALMVVDSASGQDGGGA